MHTQNQRRLSWAAIALSVALAAFELGAAFLAGWGWAAVVFAIVAGFAIVGALEVFRRRKKAEPDVADALLGFLAGAVFLMFVVAAIAVNRAETVMELRQHACPERSIAVPRE